MADTDAPTPWHRRTWADWLFRAGGIVLLLAALRTAMGLHFAPARPARIDYLLALIAFLGTSAGLASMLLGAHLFDQVPIASRWGQAPRGE